MKYQRWAAVIYYVGAAAFFIMGVNADGDSRILNFIGMWAALLMARSYEIESKL